MPSPGWVRLLPREDVLSAQEEEDGGRTGAATAIMESLPMHVFTPGEELGAEGAV